MNMYDKIGVSIAAGIAITVLGVVTAPYVNQSSSDLSTAQASPAQQTQQVDDSPIDTTKITPPAASLATMPTVFKGTWCDDGADKGYEGPK
jgi:hypothetical protein